MARQTLSQQLKAEKEKNAQLKSSVVALLKFAQQEGYLNDVCDNGQLLLDEVYKLTNMIKDYTITLKLSTKSELSAEELKVKFDENFCKDYDLDAIHGDLEVDELNFDGIVIEAL